MQTYKSGQETYTICMLNLKVDKWFATENNDRLQIVYVIRDSIPFA